jgi:hypothetical protein
LSSFLCALDVAVRHAAFAEYLANRDAHGAARNVVEPGRDSVAQLVQRAAAKRANNDLLHVEREATRRLLDRPSALLAQLGEAEQPPDDVVEIESREPGRRHFEAPQLGPKQRGGLGPVPRGRVAPNELARRHAGRLEVAEPVVPAREVGGPEERRYAHEVRVAGRSRAVADAHGEVADLAEQGEVVVVVGRDGGGQRRPVGGLRGRRRVGCGRGGRRARRGRDRSRGGGDSRLVAPLRAVVRRHPGRWIACAGARKSRIATTCA